MRGALSQNIMAELPTRLCLVRPTQFESLVGQHYFFCLGVTDRVNKFYKVNTIVKPN